MRNWMTRKLTLGALMLLAGLLANVAGVCAAELLMFDDPGCVWCRRWNAEIGPGYSRSPEGQQAPLRRIHIRNQSKAGVALARPVSATPTFVLVDEGREVGRIAGYPGSDFFYPTLDELLRRIPSPAPLPGPTLRSTMCLPGECQRSP
jgi:hypothetical protein